MSYEWLCYKNPRQFNKKYIPFTKANEHPLKPMTISERKEVRKLCVGGKLNGGGATITSTKISLDPLSLALDGMDPLSQFVKQQDALLDPLSDISAEYESLEQNRKGGGSVGVGGGGCVGPVKDNEYADVNMESWKLRRTIILNKYTTSEKLTITSSYLTGGEIIKTQTTMAQKVKHRLEQLDDFEDGSVHQMMNLTQQEYILRIEQLNQELVQAWNSDQRVKALKIAIQCSKLLADTSVMQFYPSQFVLITDILDIFGKLVYDRLRTKADYIEPGSKVPTSLPENFTPDMVPESAKETCQNWFYKIASIRELLPRLYVEIAIMKSYSFLTQTEFNQALLRLTKVIRGIGDPLVAAYARCYLCRVGMTVTKDSDFINQNLNDFLFVYHTMFNGGIRSEIAKQHIDISTYISLYTPALDWILQSISIKATDSMLDEIIGKCQEKKNNGLLINSILTTFKSNFIANRANKFVTILTKTTTEGLTKGKLLRSLGIRLNRCLPPSEHRLSIFNTAYKIISTITHPTEYILCIEPWSQYCTIFGLQQINTLMCDIITRMNKNREFENHYHELQSITDRLLKYTKDFEGLITLDNFLPIIDLFQKDSIRFDVCKNIMTTYRSKIDQNTNDAVLQNTFMYVCKVLNDSMNALTVDDERRQISNLISNFIRKVNYGNDLEKQLLFYVEARGTFPNLDGVLATLVHCVNNLAVKTRLNVYGQHTRKTSIFVKACAAYCFITIPSIVSVMTRMDLYLLSGKIALLNACLGQADACFEAAIKLILELPIMIEMDGKLRNTENYLVSFVCNTLSTLIIVPDSPEQGVLYLTRTLLDIIKRYHFDVHSNSLSIIYLHVLDMLTIASYENYPYHIPNVISNDELYGSDPKFISEINMICSQIVELILIQLKQLGDMNQIKLQSNLAMDLFEKILLKADVSKEKMFSLAVNLWNLAMKNKNSLDIKLPGKILMEVENIKAETIEPIQRRALDELTIKMKIKM